MAQRNEIAAIYGAAVIQGVALVTFPAAGAVFTSADANGYRARNMAPCLCPRRSLPLVRRCWAPSDALSGCQAGLSAGPRRQSAGDGAAYLSQFVMHALAGFQYLACGHGLHGYRLRTHGARPEYLCRGVFPSSGRHAVLGLNALLDGDGAGAGVYRHLCRTGLLVGLPFLVSVLPADSLVQRAPAPARARKRGRASGERQNAASRAVLGVCGVCLLYGVCETINGNWASLYMTQTLGATTTLASLALTIFWASVTAGRILFAAIGRWFPEGRTYRLLPS